MQNKNLTDVIKGRETQTKLGSTAASWKSLGRFTGGFLACWGLLVCLVVWGISSSVIAHEGHSHDSDNEGSELQVGDHANDIIIPAGITGAWYNPDHDGEGFFIEVVDANNNDNNNRTFVVSFYSYEEGQQMWLLGSSPLEAGARSVNVPMEIFSGGRIGFDLSEFDPGTVQRESWGTMEFSFSSCDQGEVHYEEEQFGFSGVIELTRLTSIAELGCEEPVDEQQPEGPVNDNNSNVGGQQPTNGQQPGNNVINDEQPANNVNGGQQQPTNGQQSVNNEQPGNNVINDEQPANNVNGGQQQPTNGQQP